MAAAVVDFDCAINYALHCLGYPNLTLKLEQRVFVKYVYVGRDVCIWVQQVITLQNAPVCV